MNEERWIIYNGTVHKAGELLVTAESRAVWYGDGCFETIRSYKGTFLRLDLHLERLFGGMEYLGMALPAGFEAGTVKEEILRLLEKNGLLDSAALARIQVWRKGGRGFDVSSRDGSCYAISVFMLPELPETARLATVSTRRIPASAVNPRYKLSNSINYIRASTEAAGRHADDALMLTTGGVISETTMANIFWIKNGTVYTPSDKCDILPGITRSLIIKVVAELDDVRLETGEFPPTALFEAEAVWICNSVKELVPVASVDEYKFALSHPLYERIHSSFLNYRDTILK